MKNFDKHHFGDIVLSDYECTLLRSSLQRLKRVQRIVGYGNLTIMGVDSAVKVAKNYSSVGFFPSEELDFLEKLFYEKAHLYGFYGEKPVKSFTENISRKNVVKVPGTGNFLYRGKPYETYRTLCSQVGKEVILTSGVRSIVKQFILFMDKAQKARGNLSLASRSLAPPGYSFHAVGDFDIGKVGFGKANFTERFTATNVYEKLIKLGYADLRYDEGNKLGVRFEPWHIKV